MTAKQNALVPIKQKEVSFYDDTLTAVKANDGQVYVAIKHMCNALGLTTAPQTRRIKRTAVLAKGYKGITVTVTPGGSQHTGMLRVDLVSLWLAGIAE